MEMLYHIDGLCPRTDIDMSRCGFGIRLFPAWKIAVAEHDPKLNQQAANTVIENMGRAWLDGCGYSEMHDPDNPDPMAAWEARYCGKPLKLGPNARKLYDTNCIRIQWGEWGPEHITVPGNACGLDIDYGHCIGAPRGGKVLLPHNVDTLAQAHLLLVVFTWFADCLVTSQELKELKQV